MDDNINQFDYSKINEQGVRVWVPPSQRVQTQEGVVQETPVTVTDYFAPQYVVPGVVGPVAAALAGAWMLKRHKKNKESKE